ncbi:rCG39196 [Rattus norvegicus]|uniref:RCG39196 n=1 Tax=Rattus norvegicus TaxID=10116 RepID=A6KMJ0_RAT|nr:rCG39196 [Rattus norvegicus]
MVPHKTTAKLNLCVNAQCQAVLTCVTVRRTLPTLGRVLFQSTTKREGPFVYPTKKSVSWEHQLALNVN